MSKPDFVGLPDCEPIPILYEDRSVLAMEGLSGKNLPESGKNCMVSP